MGCSPLSRPIVRVRYPRCHSPCTYLRTLDLRQELGAGFALSLNGFGRILHAEQLNVSLIADNTRSFTHTTSAGGTLQLSQRTSVLG
jgi:hypothetical protein